VSSGTAHRLVRLAGWLLTPFVVWAASFAGGWVGAQVGRRVPVVFGGVLWLVLGAVLGGATGLALWVRRLRGGRNRPGPSAASGAP
jgi:hypothetical protein